MRKEAHLEGYQCGFVMQQLDEKVQAELLFPCLQSEPVMPTLGIITGSNTSTKYTPHVWRPNIRIKFFRLYKHHFLISTSFPGQQNKQQGYLLKVVITLYMCVDVETLSEWPSYSCQCGIDIPVFCFYKEETISVVWTTVGVVSHLQKCCIEGSLVECE